VALALILVWYVCIGFLAAIGTIAITRKQLPARGEQVFFGLVLAPVAGMYLAFTTYFAAKNALPSEALAALVFTVLGLLGMRLPSVLAFAYLLHGAWDLLHELHAHAGVDLGGSATLTEIPLAYGAFCAVYDWCVAAYFITRREQWRAAGRTAAAGLAAVSLLVASRSVIVAAETGSDPRVRQQIDVSWDFGSGPGRTSNRYVGKRTVNVRYGAPACSARFTLERASFRFADVERDGRSVPEGPPFLMLTLRKHFAGSFELLPKITIAQDKLDANGKLTGKTEELVFPYREREMAFPVEDWERAEIDVMIGAPSETMGLHNPLDWSDIAVDCAAEAPK